MNNNLEYEYEIDLKDLCVSVLRKWRQIILAAVIGAVLLGGFRLVQNLTSSNGLAMSESELEAAQEDIEEAETQITTLESSIVKVESSIEANERSINNLDNMIALAESQLENLNNFLENYSAALDKLMESDDMDAEMADAMTDYLFRIDTIQSSILSKETEIMDLYESGPELEAANLDLEEQIADYEEQITEQEELIAELKEQMAQEASADVTSKVATYLVLGAFIGICCVCVYAFLAYCFDKTIHLEDDLSSYTGNPVIASVVLPDGNQKHKQNPIDRMLDRIAGVKSAADHSADAQCAIAAAKIQVLSEKKKVLVTGTVSDELIREIYHCLESKLPQNEFEVLCAANPMVNAGDILKVKDYEIVLAEAPHVTRVRELTDLNGFLRLSGAKVLGIIAVSV